MDLSFLHKTPSKEGDTSQAEAPDLSFLHQTPRSDDPVTSQAIGQDTALRPDAGKSLTAGGYRFDANMKLMQGMFKDLVGMDPTEEIESATALLNRSDDLDAGSLSFSDVLDGDSFTSWATTTMAGLAPDILSTTTTTLAGMAVGSMFGPGGTASGGASALAYQTAAKAAIRKGMREALEATAKGTATSQQKRVATNVIRANTASKYGTIGASTTNAPQGWGEAYGESVEAGDPSPLGALFTGTAMAGADVLPVKYSLDAVTDLMKMEGKSGGALTEAAKAWGKASFGEGATELGQEELLIRFRDALVPEDYAGSDEAQGRRLEAGAAGTLAGGARGGVIDAPARAFKARAAQAQGQGAEAGPGQTGTPPPGGPSDPGGAPRPSFRERAADFTRRFDPETDERGFTTGRQGFTAEQSAAGPDPAGRQDYTVEQPAPGPDPAGRQDFTAEQPAPGPDPAGRQDFTAEQSAPGPDPAGRQDFTAEQSAPGPDPAPAQNLVDRVSAEVRRELRKREFKPSDIAKMTDSLGRALIKNRVGADRYRVEMDRMQQGYTVSESQADVDAQFNAMLDPATPKQGMEVTEGSPMPTDLAGRDDITQVPTENGVFLTPDPEVAEQVRQSNGDSQVMSEVLGYGEPTTAIDPRQAETAIVRDENGAVVHSEVIDSRKRRDTEARLRAYGAPVEFQSVQQQLSERMSRRDDPAPGQVYDGEAVDSAPRDMQQGDDYPSTGGLDQRFEQLDAELNERVTPEDDPGATLGALTRRVTELEERTRDGDLQHNAAAHRELDALKQQLDQFDQPELRALLEEQEADEAGADAPVRVFEPVASGRRIRRDGMAETVEGGVFGTPQEIPRRDTRQVDEQQALESGYQVTGGAAEQAPTSIGVRVTPAQLDDAHLVTRDRKGEKGRTAVDTQAGRAPVQHLAPKKLGPRTATATLPSENGDVTVPASLAKDLRKFRQQYPNDSWEVATRRDEEGTPEFMLVRRRDPDTTTFADRRTGEPVSQADDRIQQGDDSRSVTATQRVMEGLQRGVWRGEKGKTEPDKGTKWRGLQLRDEATGEVLWVNPDPLKVAGADVNRGMGEGPMRQARGLATALAVLDSMGYRMAQWAPDPDLAPGDASTFREGFGLTSGIYGLPYNTLGPKVTGIGVDPDVSTLSPEAQASLNKLWASAPRSFSSRNAQAMAAKYRNARDRIRNPHLKREADFLEASRELREMGYTIPHYNEMLAVRSLQLPPELTEGVSLTLSTDQAWATSGAVDMWDAMSPTERMEVLEGEGLDPELSDNALDEQPNAVIEHLNTLAEDEVYVPAGDLAGDPSRRWEGAPRYFDQVPDTRDGVDLLDPQRTRPGAIPETGHGVRVHPAFQGPLGEAVRGVATLAQRVIGSRRNTVVVPWSNGQFASQDIAASLPEADFNLLMAKPQMQTDLQAMLNGRTGTLGTTMHIGKTSVIVVDPDLSPEMASIAMAHEMGHVAYKDHLGNLLSDRKRFGKLYAQFQKDREAGLVKQYMGDERMAFEEWMADRFASWLHRRSRPNQAGVANAGAFAALRQKLRNIFDGARKLIARLKREGKSDIPERMKANRTADTFYQKMADIEAKRAHVHDLRGRARTGRQRFDVDLHAELDLLTNQLVRAERNKDASLTRQQVTETKARIATLQAQLRDQLKGQRMTPQRTQAVRGALTRLDQALRDDDQLALPRVTQALETEQAQLATAAPGLDTQSLQDTLATLQAEITDLQGEFTRTGEPVPLSELVGAMDQARDAQLKREAQAAAREAQAAARDARETAAGVRNEAERIRARRAEIDAQQDTLNHWAADPVTPMMEGTPEQRAADLTHMLGDQGAPPQGPPTNTSPPAIGGEPRRNPLAAAVHRAVQRYQSAPGGSRAARFAANNLNRAMGEGAKYWRTLAETVDARMRRISEPLAQMLWSGPNTRSRLGGRRGYLNRVESESAHWGKRLTDALPNSPERAETVMRMVQRETPRDRLPPDALPLFDLMTELGEYLERNVDGFQARSVYGTRTYNRGQIISRPEEFNRLLQEKIPGLTEQDADAIRRTITLDDGAVTLETKDEIGAGPGLSARHARVLNEVSNDDLQRAGFLEDPKTSFFKHVHAAVRRAEFEATFGGQRTAQQMLDDIAYRRQRGQDVPESASRQIRQQLEEAQELGIAEPTFYDPAAKAKSEMEQLSPAQRDEAFDMFEAVMGRSNRLMGHQISPKLARFQSLGVAYVWMTTLGMAVFSQLTDLMTIAMRYRSMGAISEMTRILATMSAAERREFAEAVASVQSEATMDSIAATYGGDFMGPGMRKVTDVFFKATGLQAITDYNRSLATQMGVSFLRKELQGAISGDPTSVRRLADLGLDANDVATFFNQNGGRLVGENGDKIRQALFDFVDESMLRPQAAMRPEWSSNPWYQLLWVLKSFMWGGKKIFIDGAYREFQQMRREGRNVAESSASFQMIAIMGLPLSMLSVMLKDMAKETINTAFDNDEYEWMTTSTNWASPDGIIDLFDRTGAMGPLSLAWSMYDGTEFGTPPGISMGGPVAERAYRLSQGQIGRVAGDSVPIAGLVY